MTSHMSLGKRGNDCGCCFRKGGHTYLLTFDRFDMFSAGVACFRWSMDPELNFDIDDATDIADMMEQTWFDDQQ